MARFLKKDSKKDYMNSKDWINLAEQLPDYSRVTLSGGEPLILKGFKDVFSYVAKNYDCNLISNGLLLNEDMSDFLLSFPKFRALSISVDNVGNTIRGIRPEKWKKTEKIFKYFILTSFTWII